jgi:hypothetical protein
MKTLVTFYVVSAKGRGQRPGPDSKMTQASVVTRPDLDDNRPELDFVIQLSSSEKCRPMLDDGQNTCAFCRL